MNKIDNALIRWWNRISPGMKTTLAIGYEVSVCLLLCGNAALATYDLSRGVWLGWINLSVMLALCIVTVGRNYFWGATIQAQKKHIALLTAYFENQNSRGEQLGNIPLPVIALKMLIEHGMPVNSESLNWTLDALRKSPDVSKMN